MEMLASMNADIERLRSEMERVAREQSGDKPFTADDMPLDNTANRIMRLSVLESMLTHSEMIDVIHILLALLREESNEASQALAEQNINYRRLAQALNLQPDTNASYGYTEDEEDDEEEGEEMVTTAPSDQPGSPTPVLDKFGTDLTHAASEHLLDPVVGREREIERVAQILSRRKKNNPRE